MPGAEGGLITMAATCSRWCGQHAEDPACRSCRLAPLDEGESGEVKLRQALTAVLYELKFYEKEVDASTDLPFSFRLHEARTELHEVITTMRSWAAGHLNELDERKYQ
ncbi:hypothetical protein [Saccharopolyspora griseoalba]|uniref:Transcriptional regulator n=1 Tax=Saccharopolyspora griseoalba TaxID=1431848 RepID=A0ABW2LKH9_9PSEU